VDATHPGAPQAAAADPVIRELAARGLYIGITAWTEPSLISSGELYPPSAATPEQRLRYYASRYPITEVDATFYHPPAERTVTLWAERTPPGFVFDVKAFRLLTHHPTPPGELWRDLREELPAELAAKPTVYARDLPRELVAETLRRFASALAPLRDAGRLGLVLFQMPRYVYPSRASLRYLEWVAGEVPGLRIGVEFRQRRWLDEQHQQATLDFLASHGLTYVCVDEPQGFASSVPPVAAATAGLAEVRFHGRNTRLWEARNVTAAERFRYDYQASELAEWLPRIESLHDGGRPVHLLMNNCYGGLAVRASRLLAKLLAEREG
jgi:uncharacterized protein YecE (DUF72 family)